MGEVIKAGSFYFNGEPVSADAQYKDQEITIGASVEGQCLIWGKVGNLLVSKDILCFGASWEKLDKMNLIFGKQIQIDDKLYICRAPKLGQKGELPNEWDDILDFWKNDEEWHAQHKYFWGQEESREHQRNRITRGYFSARSWGQFPPNHAVAYIGYRPILEAVDPNSLIEDSLIGKQVKVVGPSGAVVGTLMEYNDYDLIMVLKEAPFRSSQIELPWFCQLDNKKLVAISRSAIEQIIEEK